MDARTVLSRWGDVVGWKGTPTAKNLRKPQAERIRIMKQQESDKAELERLRVENARLHAWLKAAHAELDKHGVCLTCYGSGMENSLCKCRECNGTGKAA